MLLTTKDAAAKIPCSDRTLENSRYTGKLFGLDAPSYIKFGHTVRYKESTIDAWISSLTETSEEAVQ